jgi:hypothetical protein
MPSTQELIKTAVERFQEELPALEKLKLVIELELRGRGDVQMFRVEVPGPKVSKSVGDDARVRIAMPRSDFNDLAADGKVKRYREAYDSGAIKVTGDANVMKLIGQVIVRHEERARTKKVH